MNLGRTRRGRAAVVAVAAAALLGGCASPGGQWVSPGTQTGNESPAPSSVRWSPCPSSADGVPGAEDFRFDCATLQVPLDWNTKDDGRTLDVALLRARSKRQRDRIGSLLVNPGGPGGSGVQLATYLAGGLPAEVTRRFDLVGFDPRGVGRSSPVECIADKDKDRLTGFEPDPAAQPQFDQVVAETKRVIEDCGRKYGDRLGVYSTEQTARDMDAIRAAVGDKKMTYLGYSYGTLLGGVYAHLFPKNIRALVLDGAVDPEQSEEEASEGQAAGFERAFDNFAEWCRNESCPIGPDARTSVNRILAKVRQTPAAGGGGRVATVGWVFTAVVASLYVKDWWPVVAQGLADVDRGDPSRVFRIADSYYERDEGGRYTNMMDANMAINCADEDPRLTLAQVRQRQGEWRRKYPLFGGPLAMSMLSCVFWPTKADPYPIGRAEGAPPIVVVGTKGDPATPYEQTPRLARLLGTGVVLTFEGEGHTAYPQAGRCIASAVNRYLIDVRAPSDGTSCPA